MLRFFGLFSKVSTKIVATFFMTIGLMMLGFAFFPEVLNRLSDFCNFVEGQIRDPEINDQGKFLFRTLVNENTIFGIVMTLVARAVVEFLSAILVAMWRVANWEPERSKSGKRVKDSRKGDLPPVEEHYRA